MNEKNDLPLTITVPAENRTTLTVLVKSAAGLSNTEARRLIESGSVLLGTEPCLDPVARPRAQIITIAADPKRTLRSPSKRKVPTLNGPGFDTIYLDESIIVVNKQSGYLTIPTSSDDTERASGEVSLVAGVAEALRQSGRKAKQLFVVHRIDRETSGLVCFARQERAYEILREHFRHRRPTREYLAWTMAVPAEATGRLHHYLREDPKTHRVEAVGEDLAGEDSTAKEAILDYRIEVARPHGARLRIALVTGRRNQIRAQLAAAGWPIRADRWYGEVVANPGRTALHAHRLAFDHPIRDRRITCEAPLPEDLRRMDARLFG